MSSIFGWSYPPGCSGPPDDDRDPPEECPECHAANSTDDGDPICDDAPDFCSVKCRDAYDARNVDDGAPDTPDWWDVP